MEAKRNQPLARDAMAYVLAGGRGSRLKELTDRRAKPAVYFGGKTRIIDFALSNALNSGIRRAEIPVRLRDALAGGEDIETFVPFGAKEVPAHLQVAYQAMGLVLGSHRDPADSGIHRVGEGKVDDAGFPAEIDRRLGAPVGQLQQPASASARKHEGEGVAGKRLVDDGGHFVLPGPQRPPVTFCSGRRGGSLGPECSGTNG